MTDNRQLLNELQAKADETTEAIEQLERVLSDQGLLDRDIPNASDRADHMADMAGRLRDIKAPAEMAEQMEDLAARLDTLERRLNGDTPDATNLAERVDDENIRYMGDGIAVVDADVLRERDDGEPASVPLNEHLRNGGEP